MHPAYEETLVDDNPLVRAVEERLGQAAYLELRRVRAGFHKGVLTLAGYVSSYYLRQVAQSMVQSLEGVVAIDNRIEVIPGRSRSN